MKINVLSAGAVKAGLNEFAKQLKTEMVCELDITYSTAPQIARRLAAGEPYDLLVSPASVINDLSSKGVTFDGNRIQLGSVGAGIVVRQSMVDIKINTAYELMEAVLDADSIVYNQASTGLYLDKLFERMGIFNNLKRKTKYYPSSNGVLKHIVKGHGNEIGFAALTEIKNFKEKGLKLIGPLPKGVQNHTRYEVVAMKTAKSEEILSQILNLLKSPDMKQIFLNAGIE